MRLVGEFEHMRHHTEVNRLRVERQFVKLRRHLARLRAALGRHRDAMHDARLTQQIEIGQTELQRVVAENIRHHLVQPGALALEQVGAQRLLKPVM